VPRSRDPTLDRLFVYGTLRDPARVRQVLGRPVGGAVECCVYLPHLADWPLRWQTRMTQDR
jgi:hypothetical protein